MNDDYVMDIFQNRTANQTTDSGCNDTCILYDYFEEYDEGEILFEFITNGILLNVVGLFGIMGNVISMIILSRPQMRSSINYLLTWLARCDTVLIVTSMSIFGLPAIYKFTNTTLLAGYYYRVYPFLSYVMYPLALIAQTLSVYLTLTVTLERFVAVCHPLRARSLCTYGRARMYVILIIIFSTAYNVTRFFEVNLIEEYHFAYNMTIYRPVPSALRNNEAYIYVYIHWFYLLFIYVFPFICLALLNSAIYRQVRKANKERQQLSRHQKKEIGLATMLLCVVIVFVLCNILALATNVLEAFYGIILDRMVKLSNLLVTINSSVNFIIYVIFGEKFKKLFLKLFCHHSPKICYGGRESPDGLTGPEDSIMASNGDLNLRHSLRKTNGSINKVPRALPCVYYPGRSNSKINGDHTDSTSIALNQI
ncbi:FMRFamide receptor [Cimex lectularius]|uniref:G-protein coupled receptors family 1 profile domain-containing protein n=1 Tax=Cimex lectularius TaxID=79782 RepID=A0A8I6THG6_CIMLE|nr:FMRFamide receptor [Cimex lectularius]